MTRLGRVGSGGMHDAGADTDLSTTIDVERIMQMIPHRYPFLMIDRIVDVIADKSAIGIKNVSINEYFFQGHFPRHAVMPGVLLIEAMAQTAAVLVVHTLGPAFEGKLVYFMSIEHAKFRRPGRAGRSAARARHEGAQPRHDLEASR